MITALLKKMGIHPELDGHEFGCRCEACVASRQVKLEAILARRSRGVFSSDTLFDIIANQRRQKEQRVEETIIRWKRRSFWLGITAERLTIQRGRDDATLAWAAERGWSNSLRAEHGRQQRLIEAYRYAIRTFADDDQVPTVFPQQFWEGVLCERYIALAEGRLSSADKRRMNFKWCTAEENVAHFMIELLHSQGRIGPNGLAWMREQLHQRGPDKMYDLSRSRDILRAACNLMESSS